MSCSSTIIESVFIGRDNEIDLILSNLDTSLGIDFISFGVTKMEVSVEGVTVSSEDGYITYQDGGKVTMQLGHIDGLVINKTSPLTLIVYDPLHPNGQVMISRGMEQSKVSIRAYEV